MPHLVFRALPALGVRVRQSLEKCRQSGFSRRSQDKLPVIGHQAIGQDPHWVQPQGLLMKKGTGSTTGCICPHARPLFVVVPVPFFSSLRRRLRGIRVTRNFPSDAVAFGLPLNDLELVPFFHSLAGRSSTAAFEGQSAQESAPFQQ